MAGSQAAVLVGVDSLAADREEARVPTAEVTRIAVATAATDTGVVTDTAVAMDIAVVMDTGSVLGSDSTGVIPVTTAMGLTLPITMGIRIMAAITRRPMEG